MIDESSGTPEQIDVLRKTLNSVLLVFPLAGLTIFGRGVHVVVDNNSHAPGYAGSGGFAIDGKALVGDKRWSKDDLIYLCLHEWSHVFGNHMKRRGERDPKLWNTALDMRVNADVNIILGRDKWAKPPQEGIPPEQWIGDMSPEEIYEELKKGKSGGSGAKPQGLGVGDLVERDMQDPSLSPEEAKEVFVTDLVIASTAASLIRDSDKRMPPHMAQRLVDLKKGEVNWERELQGSVLSGFGGSYSTYAPPRRKHFPFVPLPTQRSLLERSLCIACDVSGSIDKRMLDLFASNVARAAKRASKVLVVTFDQKIREQFWADNAEDAIKNLKFLTGRHSCTDVRPVFELVKKERISVTVVLTDAYLIYPETPQPRTIFAVPRGHGGVPPWGKLIHMEVSW